MSWHDELTGADAIHEIMYVQSSDPGAVGANKFWLDTTNGASLENGAILKQRDGTDTSWTVRCNLAKQAESLMLAVSDESTAITTGTGKLTFRMPFAASMTALPRANLNTPSSSGNPAIDINKNGTSIFSTTLTIDSGETTSLTAATAAVLASSPTTFSDDDEITIDIDTAGTGAKGLKITLLVSRA